MIWVWACLFLYVAGLPLANDYMYGRSERYLIPLWPLLLPVSLVVELSLFGWKKLTNVFYWKFNLRPIHYNHKGLETDKGVQWGFFYGIEPIKDGVVGIQFTGILLGPKNHRVRVGLFKVPDQDAIKRPEPLPPLTVL